MVIDASVVFKWFFPEDGHQKAREWIGKADLMGPALLGNALWKRALRGEIGASGTEIAELDDRVLTADARFLSIVAKTSFEQRVVAL